MLMLRALRLYKGITLVALAGAAIAGTPWAHASEWSDTWLGYR